MKKTLLYSLLKSAIVCCLLLVCAATVWAVPAQRTPVVITQPDGSSLTICLHGDEFYHFTTTADGYTLMKNVAGYYVYAEKNAQGTIVPSQYIAKDAEARTVEENEYLQTIPVFLREPSKRMLTRSLANNMIADAAKKDIANKPFRGLIILAQFQDRKFLDPNPKEVFGKIVTERNLKYQDYEGSVRDYFNDNSMNAFDPEFDVVGPVTLSYNQTDAGEDGAENVHLMVAEACGLVDDQVDFTQYDLNDDRMVDLVFVIFAGGGSNVPGNNPTNVWPHAFQLYPAKYTKDGVYCSRYACSTELCGPENVKMRDGIGTICHEFSHVLGLPDFYDTDYEGSGGVAPDPGRWSLMSGGSYLKNGRRPAGYAGYERYLVGWAKPTVIGDKPGRFTLNPLQESNEFMWINSTAKNEFFILENRQLSGWDDELPGHGMLAYRVDRSSEDPWSLAYNTVNANPSHTYYELLCADRKPGKHSASTPFPGKLLVESLTDNTNPSLLSWGKKPSNVALTYIEEKGNVIFFNVNSDEIPEGQKHEKFSKVEKTTLDKQVVEGDLGSWTFNQASMKKLADGQKVAALKGGTMEMNFDFPDGVKGVRFIVAKEGQKSIIMHYSVDQGKTWEKYTDFLTLKTTAYSPLDIQKEIKGPVRFRISGSKQGVALFSNIIFYENQATGIQEKVKAEMKWTVEGRTLNFILEQDAEVRVYTISGQMVADMHGVSGNNSWTAVQGGIYIVSVYGTSFRVLIP